MISDVLKKHIHIFINTYEYYKLRVNDKSQNKQNSIKYLKFFSIIHDYRVS